MKRGYAVLAVSSLINFLSVLYFLALAWHSTAGRSARFPLDDLPQPWNWLYYAVHAGAYTAVLFLAGIFGERPKSGKEVILATQRALEQQALERWRLQKEAQIEQMMRRGEPLGAVAAALASPETAERIAVLEAATAGSMSALDAARLNVRRAGHDLSLLDGLYGMTRQPRRLDSEPQAAGQEGKAREAGEEAAPAASPLSHPLSGPPTSGLDRGGERPLVTVELVEATPTARGRRWTQTEYAARDSRLALLGIPSLRQTRGTSAHGGVRRRVRAC